MIAFSHIIPFSGFLAFVSPGIHVPPKESRVTYFARHEHTLFSSNQMENRMIHY